MKQIIKHIIQLIKRVPVYCRWKRGQQEREYLQWLVMGKPVPVPHRAKQLALIEQVNRHNLRCFVETGTYLGDMVEAMRVLDTFEHIYSIELNEKLHRLSITRFWGLKKIQLHNGDSGVVIKDILKSVKTPSLFWLDGHFSSGATSKGSIETPIEQELKEIFSHPLREWHVILIDDARMFTGDGDYPTIEHIKMLATSAEYNLFEVKDDIIRIMNC